MNANPMEEQIGRLVGNLLAGGGEIFLPVLWQNGFIFQRHRFPDLPRNAAIEDIGNLFISMRRIL